MTTSVSQAELRMLMAQQKKQNEPVVQPKKKKKKQVKLPPDFFSNQRHKRKATVEMGPAKPKSIARNEETNTGEPERKRQRLEDPIVTEVTVQNISQPIGSIEEHSLENEVDLEEEITIQPVSMNKFEQDRKLTRFARDSASREETLELQEQM
jgi:hypothetical protein